MPYTRLADVTLGADTPTLNLASLNLAAWYQVRVIVPKIRTVGAGGGGGDWDRAFYRFNDDAGAGKYIWGVRNYNSSNVTNDSGGYINGIEAGHMVGPNIDANFWGSNILDIFNPGRNDIYKSLRLYNASLIMAGVSLATWGPGVWKDLAPITKITVLPNVVAESMKTGTRAVLLGMIPAATPTPVAPDSPTLLSVSDNFNRANGGLGANWLSSLEGGGAIPAIGSNEYVGQGNSSLALWQTSDPFPVDQYSEMTLGAQGNPLASGKWVGVSVRAKDTSHHYLLIYFNNAGTYTLGMYDKDGAGSFNQLGGFSNLPGPLVAGDVVRLEVEGTTLTAKVNGVTKFTRTDSKWSYGRPGIQTITSNTEQSINAWAGGGL